MHSQFCWDALQVRIWSSHRAPILTFLLLNIGVHSYTCGKKFHSNIGVYFGMEVEGSEQFFVMRGRDEWFGLYVTGSDSGATYFNGQMLSSWPQRRLDEPEDMKYR